MPRAARVVIPEVALHVTQRGINGQDVFFRPADYRNYLRYLRVFAARFSCTVHAYCLMTNHVHLLLTPRDKEGCGRLMKQLGQCYVQTTNRALGRKGTLWQGRYYSCLVPTAEYVLYCYRYVEQNPVRAGLVRRPEDYPWSSHRANTGVETNPSLSPHEVLTSFGSGAYRALFDGSLPAAVLNEIRKATRGGKRLGDPSKRRGRAPEKGSVPISVEKGSVPISGLFQRSE
jgi:putative transposase